MDQIGKSIEVEPGILKEILRNVKIARVSYYAPMNLFFNSLTSVRVFTRIVSDNP